MELMVSFMVVWSLTRLILKLFVVVGFSQLFEGMKAYRGVDGMIRLFRPDKNMARMNATAKRAALPTFDGVELINCIRKLVRIDEEWVPHSDKATLYIRPTLIGTEVWQHSSFWGNHFHSFFFLSVVENFSPFYIFLPLRLGFTFLARICH